MKSSPTAITISTIIGILSIVGAFVYIGGIDEKTGFPDSITVAGQTIEFTWTDDNTGEDLHIFTDRATYIDGLSHATVYVAVANRSGITQDVELMGHFRENKKRIENVQVLADVTREKYEPVNEEQCQESKTATGTLMLCSLVQVGTTTTLETTNEWVALDTVSRTPVEQVKEQTRLQSKTMKPVEGFIAETKTTGYTIPADGVVYYKVHIEFPTNESDNFYFTAVGSAGGIGHLDPWFDSNWDYRVKIEVNPNKVGSSSAISNIPVYLDLAGMPASFWTNASSTGADVRMVESDETTETAFEIVSFSTTTKRGELHFMADSLSTTSTSTFYIYYGNPSASAYAVTDTYGRNNVWTGYRAVYHLESLTSDSTSNSYTLTNTNSVGTSSNIIGLGADFGTANTNKRLAIASDLGMTSGNISMSAWFKVRTEPTNTIYPIVHKGQLTNHLNYSIEYRNNAGIYYLLARRHKGGVADEVAERSLSALGTSNWNYVVQTYSGTTLGISLNADTPTTNTASGNGTAGGANTSNIGSNERFGYAFNASAYIDEVRYTSNALSSAWITTEYNNQSSTSTFFYIGAEETEPAGGGSSPVSGILWFD